MPSPSERTGSDAWERLPGVFELVRTWAGPARRAMLVGGSHARNRGVWAVVGGREVTLSDLDLYVVLPSHVETRAAEARARNARAELASRLLDLGLAAPLDVGFYTLSDLESLPASHATLELRRHGQVVEGDRSTLDAIPSWTPAQAPAEEILLLLENRAFELLLTWRALGAAGELERLQGRHGVLKSALDLATALTLAAGELPDRMPERIASVTERARAGGRGAGAAPESIATRVLANAPDLPELWSLALAWRSGRVEALAPREARVEWLRVARAWAVVWGELTAGGPSGREANPYRRAVLGARRARLRRRVRQAVGFRSRTGIGPGLGSRLAHALRGTPQHRLNAAAVVLLLSAAHGSGAPTLGPAATEALGILGVPARDETRDWERAARALVRAWDLWILDGQRTADWG
ncbi:MAG TPA: hypothetical protein VEY91_08650 [Candidatus Limnocylindria bacterium]|nr:hypothetical protein [Candidatus Limnocylindria bacterium]